jgi:phosphopantothenoylcysteine decarboxylase/phosphopantothenate--cysteine ligase
MSKSREVILGVGGGIAAYKSCDLLRRLQDSGYLVTVVPTPSSLNFVGSATWEALSGRPVTTQVWERVHEVRHVSLAKNAGFAIIAPATADLIARIAAGRADDLLTNLVLAMDVPILIVPAMHPAMWTNPATVANVSLLRSRGFTIMEPDTGRLTGADSGQGRLPSTEAILENFDQLTKKNFDLRGKKVLITAGGTREPIDDVRFIGNRSSGKQGISIARAALDRGADVTIIMANSHEVTPDGAEVIHVETALEMHEVLKSHFPLSDILLMSAAVADARPARVASKKIQKSDFRTIDLVENPDLLQSLSGLKTKQIVVAFAAQTDTDEETARVKMVKKGADLIYLNDVSGGAIFGSELTTGKILMSNGARVDVAEMSKDSLADLLLDQALIALG